METFYVTNQGQRLGPLSQAEVRAKYQRGELALTESYWTEGMAGWMPLHLLVTPDVAAAEPKYGGFWIRVGGYMIDGLVVGTPTGFLMRFFIPKVPPRFANDQAAFDFMVNSFLPAFLGLIVLQFVVHWLYSAILESSSRQATLGKMVLGLKVTGLDGGRISFGRATGRYLAKYFISAMFTFCIGFLFCVWTQKKQCLHDLMAGTLVARQE